jgi:hypothetical protein
MLGHQRQHKAEANDAFLHAPLVALRFLLQQPVPVSYQPYLLMLHQYPHCQVLQRQGRLLPLFQ